MLIRVPTVLNTDQLKLVNELLRQAHFVDGKLSAGATARQAKNNQEVDSGDPHLEQLSNLVMGALVRHPLYQAAVLPRSVAVPYFARYTEGMEYGAHIDDPVMGPDPRYRSDVAITVFLSEPESYAGGELAVRTNFGEQHIKYPAGDAVMYPASSLHRVATVTKGERLVAVTWAQSLVRDPQRRELLYELYRAREKLRTTNPDAEETRWVDHTYVNLVRMWADV